MERGADLRRPDHDARSSRARCDGVRRGAAGGSQPDYEPGTNADDWIPGTRYYELGEWTDAGRSIEYGTTTTAGNYDIWEVELATGLRRQITRGLDRMDVFSQLVRPPLIEMVAFPQIGRVGLWNNRRCMNERWLMDREGQRADGYGGQPIVVEDGWAIRAWSWFPDGTRVLVAQERIPNEPGPSVPYERARLQILRFPARPPTAPLSVVGLADIDLSWAVPYGQYVAMASRSVTGAVVTGRHSGQAILDVSGSFAVGRASVEYQDFSDDGLSVINGTEVVDTPLQTVNSKWIADLTIAGERNGYLRGELNVSGPGNFDGWVESDVDGAYFDAVPVQADCPGIHQPPLVLEEVQTASQPSGEFAVWVRVTAALPEDSTHRPVQMATVAIGATSALTDARGWALLRVPDAPALTLSASAGGFLPATRQLGAGPRL